MSLENALNSAISGLHVNQKEMYFSSANVAHAGDKDYRRLEVEIGDDKLGNATIKRIKVMMDKFLEQERVQQNSTVGYTGIKEYFFDKINSIFGSPGLPSDLKQDLFPKNIVMAVEDFFSKVSMLAVTPESYSLKLAMINSAENLSNNLSNTAYKLENLRWQTDTMLEESCKAINENTQIITHTNLELSHLHVSQSSRPHLESSRLKAIHNLAEHIDISTYTDDKGRYHVYTTEGTEIAGTYSTHFDHTPLANTDLVITGEDFKPVTMRSGDDIKELNLEKLASGKIKGLVELRDKDIPRVISTLDQLAHVISTEVNNIYSAANPYPGNKKLIANTNIESSEFSGAVKFAVIDKSGKHITDENGYAIKPLIVSLKGNDLTAIADAINNHYNYDDYQVHIGNFIDDIRLIPASDIGEKFKFNLEFENGKNKSHTTVQEVSVLYGDEVHRTIFAQTMNIEINDEPFAISNTTIPINVPLENLPSAARNFIIKIKMNVNGSYAEVDYNISKTTLADYYPATKVIGDDCQLAKPQAKKYINASYNQSQFSVTAAEGLRFAIEDINSNSKQGKFFHMLGWNNLFSGDKAVELKITAKLKEHPELLSTANLGYNKNNLPNLSIAANLPLKELQELRYTKMDFMGKEINIEQFATNIIEDVAAQLHGARGINEHAQSFKEALDEKQQMISGVNIDEEVAKTMFLKNIHEASTNLIKIVDEMFSELLSTI